MTKAESIKQKMGGEVVQHTPKDTFKQALTKYSAEIKAAIPKHVSADRLLKLAQVAVTSDPKLLECYMPTVLGAIMKCSQLGMEPNNALGQCYLIPFKNRKANRIDAQLIIGYRGLIDLARRSRQVKSIAAHVVHENDDFEFEYGTNAHLRHVPSMDTDNAGKIVCFYAVATMESDGFAFEVMSNAAIQRVMLGSQSRGKYGPWADHYEEMGRKTVVRRLSKYLPLTIEAATAVDLDHKAEQGEEQFGDVIDVELVSEPDTEDDAEEDNSEAAA